jgi:hypothetical protein
MATKQPSKGGAARPPASGNSGLIYGAIIVAVIGLAAFALRSGGADEGAAPASPTAASSAETQKPTFPQATPEDEAAARATAAMGPHKQANLPPIPFQGYPPPRPAPVVTAAFEFAAEHPEVLSYVPCFCGCERMGHRGNHNCFVKARDANGDVVAWEEHGVECAVCIDVATRSRQMYAAGASVTDIRAAIEREFVPNAQAMTPTPKPPAHDH